MRIGVNIPNFGPGTDPGVLRRWAATVEDLGYGMLVVSDHIVVTPDVREQYPAPFYEPFTTLAWLAGIDATGDGSAPPCSFSRTAIRCWWPGWPPTSPT